MERFGLIKRSRSMERLLPAQFPLQFFFFGLPGTNDPMSSLLMLPSIASVIVTLITPIPGIKHDLSKDFRKHWLVLEEEGELPANIRSQLEMDTHHVIFQFSPIWEPSITFQAAIWHFAVIL